MAYESPLKTSESLASFEQGNELLDSYIEAVKHDIELEVERIIAEKPLLGEGKAAKVFDLELNRLHCPTCVKIWNPELENLKNSDLVEYKKIQAHSPEQEFDLQDDLYVSGLRNIPRAIAYGKFGPYHILVMEKIPGYTLKKIIDQQSTIGNLSWKDLENNLIDLNRNHRVAHRDLHPGNIMLKTEDKIEEGSVLNGELVFIDFGLSKKTPGMPAPDDFKLTIGNKSIIYKNDKESIDQLQPKRKTSYGSSPFVR